MIQRILAVLSVGATFALVSGNSFAIDPQTNVGANCRQTSGGSYGLFGGTVFNNSTTSTLNLICPLLVDEEAGGAVFGGNVQMYDRNPNDKVSCTIFTETAATNGTGTLFQNFTTVSTTNADNSVNPFNKPVGSIPDGDHMFATCSVPPNSGGNVSHISQIFINEE